MGTFKIPLVYRITLRTVGIIKYKSIVKVVDDVTAIRHNQMHNNSKNEMVYYIHIS